MRRIPRISMCVALGILAGCTTSAQYSQPKSDTRIELPVAGSMLVAATKPVNAPKLVRAYDPGFLFSDPLMDEFCGKYECNPYAPTEIDLPASDLTILLGKIYACMSNVAYDEYFDGDIDSWDCPDEGAGDCEDLACAAERCAYALGAPKGSITWLHALPPLESSRRYQGHMVVLIHTREFGDLVMETNGSMGVLGISDWLDGYYGKISHWRFYIRTGDYQWMLVNPVPIVGDQKIASR